MNAVPRFWNRSFFLAMAMLAALVVILGFRITVDENLIHPDWPRPLLLWIHALLFTAWIVLFVAQSTLVRSRQVKWHRRLGMGTIVVGTAMPVVGVATAFVMAHLRAQHGEADATAFLLVSNFDMLTFALVFGLAVTLRTKRELHRRLMFIATCTLTNAAFFRFLPPSILGMNSGYLFADVFILLGVARDLIVDRRVHPVYLVALPLYVVGQTVAVHLNADPGWLAMANALVR